MTAEQLEQFRRQLKETKEELLKSLSAIADSTAPVSPDKALGRLTRQDALLAQQMALETKRRNQARLHQVGAALSRLDRGEYGICARCKEEVAEARLQVRPEAHLCVRCAEQS